MSVVKNEGLLYVGSDIGFAELPQSGQLQRDDYGLDTLTRMYGGAKYRGRDFLNTLVAGAADAVYTAMTLVEVPILSPDRAWSTLTARFVGKADGKEPLVSQEDSWEEDTVQAQWISGNDDPDLQVIVDYRSPTTTYTYYRQARPTTTTYDTVGAQQGALGIEIIRKRGSTRIDGSVATKISKALVPRQQLKGFERVQIGQWWKCVETWKWALVQPVQFIGADQSHFILN